MTKTLHKLFPAFQLSLRAALAAGVAFAIAQITTLEYPLYAMIGAVIVTDLSPAQTRKLGLQRLAGSAVGAAAGAALSQFLRPAAWTIALSVFAAMFLSHLLRLQGAAKLSGYVSGIVVLGYSDNAWSYGFFRLIETMLGIGVACSVSFVPKLLPVDEPQRDS